MSETVNSSFWNAVIFHESGPFLLNDLALMMAAAAKTREQISRPRAKISLKSAGGFLGVLVMVVRLQGLLRREPQSWGLPAKEEALKKANWPDSGSFPESSLKEKSAAVRLFMVPIDLGMVWFKWFLDRFK
ncbi:hypothetical protein TorRG33x02_202410 [Trema orientale]|uniref:Uncharacterized protein n=1 Tax=Trema orientale TaxID=63057 RepID=A0A2P5EEG9_TREOI|nr:hypothetical protein TorRG33x02_202410 [Trema orientale]